MKPGKWFAFSALSFWSAFLLLFAPCSAMAAPQIPAPAYTVVDMGAKEPVVLGHVRLIPEFVSSDIHPVFASEANMLLADRDLWLRKAAINTSGEPVVVGTIVNSDEPVPGKPEVSHMRAFVYRVGMFTDLGTLPGGTQSQSSGLNHHGAVVGWSNFTPDGSLHHAFLYNHGKMIDLNTRIPVHSGWVLEEASDINDLGLITGVGSHRGAHYLFLLIPTSLTPSQAEQARKQMEAKKREFEELFGPRSNLDRLGPVAAQILDGATRVETFRVEYLEHLAVSDPQIEGTFIIATGPVLGETEARQISAVLRDPKPYRILSQPACGMIPAVVFRVWQGKSYVDVVICFHCSQLVVRGYDDTGKRVSEMGRGMTEDEILIFKAIAKQSFPQDAVIQAL